VKTDFRGCSFPVLDQITKLYQQVKS